MTFDEWFEKGLEDETLYTTDELVAKWAWQAATLAERERCAKLCEGIFDEGYIAQKIRGE